MPCIPLNCRLSIQRIPVCSDRSTLQQHAPNYKTNIITNNRQIFINLTHFALTHAFAIIHCDNSSCIARTRFTIRISPVSRSAAITSCSCISIATLTLYHHFLFNSMHTRSTIRADWFTVAKHTRMLDVWQCAYGTIVPRQTSFAIHTIRVILYQNLLCNRFVYDYIGELTTYRTIVADSTTLIIAMNVHTESGFIHVLVIVTGCCVTVTVARQTLTSVSGRSRTPFTLIVHWTALIAIWTACMMTAFAFRMLQHHILMQTDRNLCNFDEINERCIITTENRLV